jgi:hypothetical protein
VYEQNGQADVQKDDHTDHDCVRTLGKKEEEDDNQYKHANICITSKQKSCAGRLYAAIRPNPDPGILLIYISPIP